ncbi:hypothetical protein ACFL20_07030 [Spirochaetota bacterium]
MKRIIFCIIIAHLIFSCTGSESTTLTEIDVTEFVYDTESSGTFNYSLSATPYSRNLSYIRTDPTSDGKLTLYAFFEQTKLALCLKLKRTGGSWKISSYEDNPWLGMATGYYNDGYIKSQIFTSASHDINITEDDNGALKKLHFYYGGGLDLSSSTYGAFIDHDETVDSIALDINFTLAGYIAKNYTTTSSVDEIRTMDTRSIINGVNQTIMDNLASNPQDYLPLLVDALVSGESDPVKKIKIIHDWICSYVHYDFDALNDPEVDFVQSPFGVMTTRKTDCGGTLIS